MAENTKIEWCEVNDGWAVGTVADPLPTGMGRVERLHPKGGDPDEWPADLRVREFPH